MSKPRLTVLMPTYNVEPYVRESIESVLAQTFTDFQLLVMDDHSTDGTLEVVRKIDDPRIRIVQNEKNVGLSENLNRGLDLIDTEFFARMDGDDIALPQWLQREVEYLDSHPEVGVCGGGGQRFGTSQSIIRFPEEHADIAANMLFGCTTIVPTVRMDVVRRNNLRYRRDAFPAEDYRFWADCLRVTQLHNIADILFRYRMHATQICTSRKEEQQLKVAEVRRYMLEWLSGDFTEEDKNYHTGAFMAEAISSKQDYADRRDFCGRLVAKNRSTHHFDEKALRRTLESHLTLTLYGTIVDRYFNDGYSPSKYLRYLASGLALRTGSRYETKFLMKSLLGRKA